MVSIRLLALGDYSALLRKKFQHIRSRFQARSAPTWSRAILFPIFFAPSALDAQTLESKETAPAGGGTEISKEKPKKRAKVVTADGNLGRLELSGRVFFLAELAQTERNLVDEMAAPRVTNVESLDLSVSSARLRAKYRAPFKWLRAQVEIEAKGNNAELRDGFVEVREKPFDIRAGQHKLPLSVFEIESRWDLPIVRRDFVHDLMTDWLDVGFRQPGASFEWRGEGEIRPRLSVGVFQGTRVRDVQDGRRRTEYLAGETVAAQSYVARAELDFSDLEVSAFYNHRLGSPALRETNHYWTFGVAATYDGVFSNGGLRAWLDGNAGATWYEHIDKPADDEDATFLAARALVAYRFGGTAADELYFEPFGMFSLFEPDADVVDDFAWQQAVGINVGLWDRARLALQGELTKTMRNFPAAYFDGQSQDRVALLAQAMVVF